MQAVTQRERVRLVLERRGPPWRTLGQITLLSFAYELRLRRLSCGKALPFRRTLTL
jgi:hypothetical protein